LRSGRAGRSLRKE